MNTGYACSPQDPPLVDTKCFHSTEVEIEMWAGSRNPRFKIPQIILTPDEV